MRGFLNRLRSNPGVAVAVVTAVTIVLVGGVVATTTSLGCGAADRFDVNLPRCAALKTAIHLPAPTPSPLPSPRVTLQPIPPATMPATAYPPNPNPGSYYPPGSTVGSQDFPPQDPFVGPASYGGQPTPTLACRLPVYAGPPGSGGFISFPSGNFTADPRSAVALPSPSPGSSPPTGPGPGYGMGYNGMAYDQAHSRWLPVRPEWVSPDGAHYAYGSPDSIYLVDAATNTQVEIGSGHAWSVLRVLNDRVYAIIPNAPGFYVVPFSGAVKQVTAIGYWQGASATAAFGTETSAAPPGATIKMIKLDIASGATSNWFSPDGVNLTVMGFDVHGNPIVQGSFTSGTWVVWLTTSPSSGVVITNSGYGLNLQGTAIGDSHGIWFPAYFQYTNAQGFVLYVAGSGLYWMTSVGGSLAGPCI